MLEGLSQLLMWVAVSTLLPSVKYIGRRMEDFTFNVLVVLCGLLTEAASLVLLAIIRDQNLIFVGTRSFLFHIHSFLSTNWPYLEGDSFRGGAWEGVGAGFLWGIGGTRGDSWCGFYSRVEAQWNLCMEKIYCYPYGSFHYNRIRAFEQIWLFRLVNHTVWFVEHISLRYSEIVSIGSFSQRISVCLVTKLPLTSFYSVHLHFWELHCENLHVRKIPLSGWFPFVGTNCTPRW